MKTLHSFAGTGLLLALLMLLAPCAAVAGRPDGSSGLYQTRIISHGITPALVTSLESRCAGSGEGARLTRRRLAEYAKRTVFWRGVVGTYARSANQTKLIVRTECGRPVTVVAKQTVRNLDYDRTGYEIGVKGRMVLDGSRLLYLKAHSVVLLAPPAALSFPVFAHSRGLKESFRVQAGDRIREIADASYPFIQHRIFLHHPAARWEDIDAVAAGIVYYSRVHGLDPLLVAALVNIESAFDTGAVSRSGAVGLGQLMPGTAAILGVNPYDPMENLLGTTRYLKRLIDTWQSSTDAVSLALASYNAGPGAVKRHGGVPPYSETKNYVFFINYLRTEFARQIAPRA